MCVASWRCGCQRLRSCDVFASVFSVVLGFPGDSRARIWALGWRCHLSHGSWIDAVQNVWAGTHSFFFFFYILYSYFYLMIHASVFHTCTYFLFPPALLRYHWHETYLLLYHFITSFLGFPCGSESKESACNAREPGSIPGLGRSSGEGKGYPLWYSCLENPWTEEPGRLQSMGSKSQTRSSD